MNEKAKSNKSPKGSTKQPRIERITHKDIASFAKQKSDYISWLAAATQEEIQEQNGSRLGQLKTLSYAADHELASNTFLHAAFLKGFPVWGPGREMLFYEVDYELTPTLIQASEGMTEAPDTTRWRACVENGYISLGIMYDFFVPTTGPHRFTGFFSVCPELDASGVVEIHQGGAVNVCAHTSVQLIDPEYCNFEGGWGSCDPEAYLALWRSECLMPHPYCHIDNEVGLHPFSPEIHVRADVDSCGAVPGNLIRIWQSINITAGNAGLQFEWNKLGMVITRPPILTLKAIKRRPAYFFTHEIG